MSYVLGLVEWVKSHPHIDKAMTLAFGTPWATHNMFNVSDQPTRFPKLWKKKNLISVHEA